MTDDTAASRPAQRCCVRGRISLYVAALALVGGTAVACGSDDGDDTPTATDSGASSTVTTSPSASESPAASDTPSASESTTTTDDPVPSPIVNRAVRAAIADDFPALVPSGVPAGWTVVAAAYDAAKGGTWRIDLTDPNGAEVVLVQAKATVDQLVAQYLGKDAAVEGTVDLSNFGTGVWKGYGAMDQHGLAKKFSGTGALVYGASQDSMVTLAQELLTAEDAQSGDGG